MSLSAFGFSLKRFELSVLARVTGLEVGQLLPLLPPVLAEAAGRLDGSFTVRRDNSGIQIGAGRLMLQYQPLRWRSSRSCTVSTLYQRSVK